MEICVLASGSSGNCFYVENKNKAILIDSGISCKQIVERLKMVGKDVLKIKGIFISHEHSDHVKGADVFVRKFHVPIFLTKKTFENCFFSFDEDFLNIINNNSIIDLCDMEIEAFSKSHNCPDPISFNIHNGKQVSIITDVGYACDNVIRSISTSDFLCIESNYDEEMLENGQYPYFLKKWIKSDIGHLSNNQAALGVLENASTRLRNIVLSHLSKNNNTTKLAFDSFKILKQRKDLNPEIFVSEREIPTKIFKI